MTRIHSINKVHLRKTICFEEVCNNAKKSTHFHFNNSIIYTSQFHATYGSIMPGRYFSSGTGYRYGFNTQLKSDEISGNGNHTTALFWEYDTRLGRRWNVDPIVKPFLSSYCILSNSPLSRIDPLGDDDYFDENGNYLGTDNSKSNNIQIIIASYLENDQFFVNANKGIVDKDVAKKYTQKFSDFIKSNISSENRQDSIKAIRVFTSVINRYTKKAGIDEKVGVYSSSGSDIAHYDPNNDKISANIANTRDNVYEIVNVLVHEKAHKDDKSVRTFLSHAEVCFKAFQHSSFDKMDAEARVGYINSFADRVLNHIVEGGMGNIGKAIELLDKFNKYFKGRYIITLDLISANNGDWSFKVYDLENGTSYGNQPWTHINAYEH